ncbi:MAG: hypothetical protein WC313_04110 [Candidatus Kapaibacterium sp.]|jgi:hypothetical protein
MPTLTVESNGMIERTAVYYNGVQLARVKELYVYIDENGAFDALIQYIGTDKQEYTKQIFTDTLTNIITTEPSFTEEEASLLQNLSIESEGNVEDTYIYLNDEELEGIISMLLHIKVNKNKTGILSFIGKSSRFSDEIMCKSEITFRNEDDSESTERIF